MSYLILPDYKKQIQTLNLTQVTGGDNTLIDQWQRNAQEKCISYLTQKYDTEAEFTDTKIWDITKSYSAGDRVYLGAPGYLAASSYSIGQYVTYNNFLYKATAIATGAFDPTKWTLIGAQYAMYYGTMPHPLFNVNLNYERGDQVFWKGKVYTALSGSAAYDPIQYPSYNNIPAINYFPDKLVNTHPNPQWGTGAVYTIPANTAITDALWTAGDNRSSQMVEACIDIVLYKVHQRISPQNVPSNRADNYFSTIKWLEDCALGTCVTAPLIRRQPNQGGRIRFGGNPKLNNSY